MNGMLKEPVETLANLHLPDTADHPKKLPANEADGHSRPFRPDPLTLVLESSRLRCMMPGVSEMTAPWGVTFGGMTPLELRAHAESLGLQPPPWDPPTIRGSLLTVIRGNCWLDIPEHDVHLPLAGGDLVLITRPCPYTLRDKPETPATHMKELIRREHIEQRLGLRHGGGGAGTAYIHSPFFFEDDQENPLLASLPPVIHVRGEQGRAVPWLEPTVQFIAQEVAEHQPGELSVVNHLAHVLFIQAVRAHFATLSKEGSQNWFMALSDPEIGPALGLMHLKPDQPWTVGSLADHVSMSRSAFAARFMTTVGQPPLQYLTECRMRKAKTLLREGGMGIKAIASKVGYATESAFSNAFKRHTGTAPGAYRSASPRPKWVMKK